MNDILNHVKRMQAKERRRQAIIKRRKTIASRIKKELTQQQKNFITRNKAKTARWCAINLNIELWMVKAYRQYYKEVRQCRA